MKLIWTASFIGVAFALACDPKEAESDDDGETDPPPISGGSAETDPTTSATDGPVETTSETDDDATDTDAAGCVTADPSTAAAFKVLLDAWPDQSDAEHNIDSVCVIDAVSVEAAAVITALTCDVDGVMRGAKFEISAAPQGLVDWQVGQSVSLHSRFFEDELGKDVALHVTLPDDPAALLVDGRSWWGDSVPSFQDIGPIHREVVMSCALGDIVGDPDARHELTYSLQSGATLSLWSGHHGSLAIDDSHLYAIDLGHSEANCCHGNEHSLIRRIASE